MVCASGALIVQRASNQLVGSQLHLHEFDVLGTRTLRAASFGVRHFLPFSELFKADALDGGRMEEKVFGATRIDEPKTLVRNFLDCTLSHFQFPKCEKRDSETAESLA